MNVFQSNAAVGKPRKMPVVKSAVGTNCTIAPKLTPLPGLSATPSLLASSSDFSLVAQTPLVLVAQVVLPKTARVSVPSPVPLPTSRIA